jgi:hypothetical protein
MGYYIDTPHNKNKAKWLVDNCDAVKLPILHKDSHVSPGYVPVIVIDNEYFEAAGIAFDRDELEVFTSLRDGRPKQFLYMPRNKVIELCPLVEKHLKWD